MPLYEYRCEDCDHRFEMLQRIGEGSEGLACSSCGKDRLVKQFSTFAAAGVGEDVGASSSAAGSCGRGAFT